MLDRGEMLGYTQCREEFSKLFVGELHAIIRYDGMRNAESGEGVSFEET
jgi:hypothetical protein